MPALYMLTRAAAAAAGGGRARAPGGAPGLLGGRADVQRGRHPAAACTGHPAHLWRPALAPPARPEPAAAHRARHVRPPRSPGRRRAWAARLQRDCLLACWLIKTAPAAGGHGGGRRRRGLPAGAGRVPAAGRAGRRRRRRRGRVPQPPACALPALVLVLDAALRERRVQRRGPDAAEQHGAAGALPGLRRVLSLSPAGSVSSVSQGEMCAHVMSCSAVHGIGTSLVAECSLSTGHYCGVQGVLGCAILLCAPGGRGCWRQGAFEAAAPCWCRVYYPASQYRRGPPL